MKLSYFILLVALVPNAFAFFNLTYLNTTIYLQANNTGHVTEIFTIFISNSSVPTYIQDRQALNLSLTDWRKALNIDSLVEHVINPTSSITKFALLPGPISSYLGTSGTAQIIFSYDVSNVTYVKQISPRHFLYSFNNAIFNFVHTASGQSLPSNAKLTVIIPKNAQIVALYPAPDKPLPNFISNYSNINSFSWFSQEPLEKFSLSYIVVESLQAEVFNYLSNIYYKYTTAIYFFAVSAILIAVIYLYIRTMGVR